MCKKLIYFLLLLPLWASAQVSTGQEQEFDYGIKNNAPQTVTTSDYITTTGADGTQGRILPENISMNVIPPTIHYIPTAPNLQGHFKGIDEAFGNITQTTAGVITRVWWTADQTTITAGTFYLTNPLGKGTAASAIQNVVNGDNVKTYFSQDIIGNAFVNPTVFPAGTYAGNLSASTSPNNAQQRYSVELYRCNTDGTPIASGVSGAPVGSLGVTVIVLLDSGLLTLPDNEVVNVPVNGTLGGAFSIAVGERIRYHVAAEKVGTAGGNITQTVYYGTNYNSYLDVPVTFNTSSIVNISNVTGATTTEALNTLNVRGLQPDYDNSTAPQITTKTPLGAFTVRRGSAADTNNILVGQNGAGTNTFSVDGNGKVTTTPDAIINNLTVGKGGGNISNCTAFGIVALGENISGTSNTAIGYQSLSNLTASNNNTGVGAGSLREVTSGDGNISIGTDCARYLADGVTAMTSSTNGTFLGSQVRSFGNGLSNQIVIGRLAVGIGSNSAVLGNDSITKTALKGNILIGTTTDNSIDRIQTVGSTTQTGQFKSTLSTGTAPFSVASTTLNTNLNADLLDGVDSSAIALLASPALTGTPTAPTATVGTNTTQIATTAFVQANSRPYKVYTALLTQSSTSAPVATVLENTLGGAVVWTRDSAGAYKATLSGAFTVNKTFILTSPYSAYNTEVKSTYLGSNEILVGTFNSSGTQADGIMVGFQNLEIRVYP